MPDEDWDNEETQSIPHQTNPAAETWVDTHDEPEANLATARAGLDAIEERPTKRALDQESTSRKRGFNVIIAVILLALIGGYLFTYFVSRDVGATAAQQELLSSTVRSLESTNIQRQAVGLPPVDIQAVVDDVEAGGVDQAGVIDAVTLNIIALLETDPRFRGPAGEIGKRGPAGEPCLPTNPLCVGPPGLDGSNGTDGTSGTDGADGKDGKDGIDGVDGTDGTNGRDGSPASTLVINRSDGTTVNCPRTGGSDLEPVYSCRTSAPAPPPEENGDGEP